MRAFVLALALLATAALLPVAQAQQSGALVLHMEPPEALTPEVKQVTFAAVATLTMDLTAYTNLNGIPVTYTVTKLPAWASAIVSPSSDVFPLDGPPHGTAMTVSRTFVVTVTTQGLEHDATDVLAVTATTSPGLFGGAVTGTGETLVTYIAPDDEEEECHDAVTKEELARYATEAANAYNEYQRQQSSGDEVTVQNAAASRVPTTWIAAGAFALVGAGVGLVLRRRFG